MKLHVDRGDLRMMMFAVVAGGFALYILFTGPSQEQMEAVYGPSPSPEQCRLIDEHWQYHAGCEY